jgi:hypothetical protein
VTLAKLSFSLTSFAELLIVLLDVAEVAACLQNRLRDLVDLLTSPQQLEYLSI